MITLTENVDVLDICVEAFNENSDYSEQLNREQLDEGKKADGTLIKEYAFITKELKYEEGKQIDPPNLRDKGGFQDNIKHFAVGEDISYISTDHKLPLLIDRDGPAILGISTESQVKLIPRLLKSQNRILKQIYS